MDFLSPAHLWLLIDYTEPYSSPKFMLNTLNLTAGKDCVVLVKDLFSQLRQTGEK